MVQYSLYFEDRCINVIILKGILECTLWAGKDKSDGFLWEPSSCITDGRFLDHMNDLASPYAISHRMSPLFFGRLSVVQSSL